MARYIYFVRHGQSESNAEKILRGPETPLTEKGREQAKLLGERFKTIPVDIIITSTFPRAIETGEIVARETGRPIIENLDILVEYDHPPEVFGLPWNNEQRLHVNKQTAEKFLTGERFSTEETFEELLERAKKTITYLQSRSEEHILVVSHGKFIQFLVGFVCFGELLSPELFQKINQRLIASNTGITRMEVIDDGSLVVRQWNDIAHLG